ncbi:MULTISPECIES: helix-turn-helix domain-containing protein [Luteimonas]|uniref:helix-turn-helix domain-containing protein n=1 Tax=Luteimonas cellulosilyticus TaxID=2683586 RepID=UPI000C7DCF7A
MTLAEAAERCACSPKTVRRAIDLGDLVAVRLGSSSKSDRIHPADLERYWQLRRTAGAPVIPTPAVALKIGTSTAEERLEKLLGLEKRMASRTRKS